MTHPVTPLACHPSEEGIHQVTPSPVFRQGESHPLNERDLLKVSFTEGVPEYNEGEGGLR